MISLHAPETTTFTHHGHGLLDPHILSPVVTEEIGGQYQLEFTYPADAPLAEYILPGALVAVPSPVNTARQAFRITTIDQTLTGLLRVTALHLSFDLARVVVADTNIVNKTPAQALTQLRGASNPANAYTSSTSMTGVVRTVRVVRQSLLECLFNKDGDNTFAARYGGEFNRNNLHLQHHPRLGADNGVTIRDRKNLTGYKATLDHTTTLTRVLPVGFDGLLLDERFVDSPRLNQYPKPLVGVMRFEHIKAAKEGEPPAEGELPLPQAKQALKQAVRDAFDDGLDLPTVSYEVNFVDLTTTKEYAGYAKLEKVSLGDTVTVIHSDYRVEIKARVMGYTYNPLTKAYISLTLGQTQASLTSATRAIRKNLEAIKIEAGIAAELAVAAQTSADGKSTIHYGSATPQGARLGDTWFKVNGEKTEIWIRQLGTNGQPTWVSVASDINYSQMQAELDQLESTLAEVDTRVTAVNQKATQTAQALASAQAELDELETVVAGIDGRVFQVDAKANQTQQALATTNQQVTAARQKTDQTAAAHDALRLEFNTNKQDNEQALVAIRNDVLLRATKGDLIAQINVSPETILIDGKRIHITGTTIIDNGIIKTAMIADAAITNAKIQALDAGKITTGYLAAARIAAGANTSDKLTIANGFIKTAMIADAAITNAKIQALDASKITTGFLAAARIAAGAITSDKLTIANGFIKTAMIADAAITNAKISWLDVGKITAGYLDADRIAAGSITADKLATNAIQVGLAGWTSSIRITPTQIAWYNGSTLEGKITAAGMQFWYGTRYIGEFARRAHKDKPNVQGIVGQLAYKGDYVAWTYQENEGGTYYTCLTLDPKGLFYGKAGIHLGSDLRTGGYKFYTTGSRYVTLQDCTLTGSGTHPGWVGQSGLSKIVFHTYDLMIVTNGSYYNMTRLVDRTKDLMSRVNSLISLLNHGWITTISRSGTNITWQYYSNTGLSTMSTNLA
ncbi:phage tail spike protein [Arcanobacterium canis]